ncbi:uncharacterized protein [Panulirus ornatus]|uniref:uncharacterized protein isoform X4 n=1 Tax=Panulirus ornatus TaxID=150431 RepID=UPI003A8A6EAA
MASMSSGMANGTSKPGYMNSFMSFLENQEPGDKTGNEDEERPEPNITSDVDEAQSMYENPRTNIEETAVKEEIPEIKTEISSTVVEIDPPEEDVTPTDHTPADPTPSTDQPPTACSINTEPSEKLLVTDGENTNSSEATSTSDGGEVPRSGRRNVARRGRRRSVGTGGVDQGTGGVFISSGRGGSGRGGVKRVLDGNASKDETPNIDEKPSSTSSSSTPSNPPKRRGRPPSYPIAAAPTNVGACDGGEDNIVSSTDDRKSPSKLSSAYNYAGGRAQRQNQTIRLPEGPQLTAEQLEMVESQFKSGDFVMAKKDMDMMEHPPIWRIDGKSLLQKFQAFEKDGKTLYRNISTYSGWTSQAKALYVGVHVTFVFQSRYDTVVELVGIKDADEEPEKRKEEVEPSWSAVKNQQQDFEISEELRSHMPSFEIYLQTLISQALDNNFLMEIYEENDDYFVERVKVIDELAEQRKKKILEIVHWDDQFRNSLDTWPCINVMITKNADICQACSKNPATKLSQLYGQPYNQQTLRSREPLPAEIDAKNFEVCDRCSNISQMYNKVSHQKYDYYSQCKSTVTNMRVTHPSKHTTTILRDLLANDHWIMGLFRSMCTTWIKVDRLYQEETESLKKTENETT